MLAVLMYGCAAFDKFGANLEPLATLFEAS